MHLFCEWLWIIVKCLDSSRMVGLVNGTWQKILTCNVAREISRCFHAEACVRAKRLFPSERLVHRAADLLLSLWAWWGDNDIAVEMKDIAIVAIVAISRGFAPAKVLQCHGLSGAEVLWICLGFWKRLHVESIIALCIIMMFFSSPLVSGLKMTGWFRCKQRAIVLNKDRLLGWHRPLVFCERKKPSCARIPYPTSNNSLRLPALVPWWMLPPKTRLALLFAVTVNGWGFAFQVLSCIALRRVVCHQGDGAKKWHLQHLELALMWTWTFPRKPVESDLYHKTSMFLACGCIWVKSTNWEVQCSKARRVNIEFSRSPNRLLRPWPFGQAWRCCMAHLSQTKATLKSLPVNETLQLSSWTYGDAVFDKY